MNSTLSENPMIAALLVVLLVLLVLGLHLMFTHYILKVPKRCEIYYKVFVKRNTIASPPQEHYLYVVLFSSDEKSCSDAKEICDEAGVEVLTVKQLFHIKPQGSINIKFECQALEPSQRTRSVVVKNERILKTVSVRFMKRRGYARENTMHVTCTVKSEEDEESINFPFTWNKEPDHNRQNHIPDAPTSIQANGDGSIGFQINHHHYNRPECSSNY